MAKAPRRPTDPLNLADWLEIQTLIAPDRNASRGDLQSMLQVAAVADEDDQERLVVDTFTEIYDRSTATGLAYPFEVDGSLVSCRTEDWRQYVVYTFCLLLSYVGVKKLHKIDPTRLFEEVSTSAAKNFLQGRAMQFAFPRRKLPRSFAKAVNEVCRQIGEGRGFYGSQVLDAKDDAVDIIAWRPFPDRLSGQLIVFGQCAAGNNWYEKRSELNPDAFCKKWMCRQPVSPLTRAFFTPHRVESLRWDHIGYDAGIVFDRCRIAHLAHAANDYHQHIVWSEAALTNDK